jgi:hypothetical protein
MRASRLDAAGHLRASNHYVWTGTSNTGNPSSDCSDWTSTIGTGQKGIAIGVYEWSAAGLNSCSSLLPFYCVSKLVSWDVYCCLCGMASLLICFVDRRRQCQRRLQRNKKHCPSFLFVNNSFFCSPEPTPIPTTPVPPT